MPPVTIPAPPADPTWTRGSDDRFSARYVLPGAALRVYPRTEWENDETHVTALTVTDTNGRRVADLGGDDVFFPESAGDQAPPYEDLVEALLRPGGTWAAGWTPERVLGPELLSYAQATGRQTANLVGAFRSCTTRKGLAARLARDVEQATSRAQTAVFELRQRAAQVRKAGTLPAYLQGWDRRYRTPTLEEYCSHLEKEADRAEEEDVPQARPKAEAEAAEADRRAGLADRDFRDAADAWLEAAWGWTGGVPLAAARAALAERPALNVAPDPSLPGDAALDPLVRAARVHGAGGELGPVVHADPVRLAWFGHACGRLAVLFRHELAQLGDYT